MKPGKIYLATPQAKMRIETGETPAPKKKGCNCKPAEKKETEAIYQNGVYITGKDKAEK